MIISVDELKEFITTDVSDKVLEAKLQALETTIRKRTNNNFQNRNYRLQSPIISQKLYLTTNLLQVGDTIQIIGSTFNDGLYVIKEIDEDYITLDRHLIDESMVSIAKIEYPMDVKMGVVEIMKWKLKNEAVNNGDTSKKEIQSETISRHSVTYVQDSTESDISEDFGVPKKYIAFLKGYKKARF